MCKGGSLQYTLQFNQIKLPKPHKIRVIQMIIQIYNNMRYTINTRYTRDINKSHPRAKHAPSGTYSTWTAFTGN